MDLLAALVEAGVRFVIVGAHALAVHGVPRATGDLDVWVDADGANPELVWGALVRFGAPLAPMGILPADFARPEQVVQLGLPPRRIDILTSISGVAFEDAWAERVTRRIGELDLPFLGRGALIRNKRASGRPKDLADLEALGVD